MGQHHPSQRCERCGALKVLVKPCSKETRTVLRCVKCDEIDPLKLLSNVGWIESGLRPPK